MSKQIVAPTSNRGNAVLPAVLDQCQQVARAIDALAALAKKADWQFEPLFFTANGYDPDGRELSARGNFHSLGDAAIPPLRQLLAQTQRMVGVWQDLQRPATRLDIGKAVAMLLLSFPDSNSRSGKRRPKRWQRRASDWPRTWCCMPR